MSYFASRPRAYSKPTKEETNELSNLLSKCSAQDLRAMILSAADGSPIAAQLFMKAIRNADLTTPSHLQPVQPNQHHTLSGPCYFDTGLLTPVDVSEDSEMSGTENTQPQTQHHYSARPESFMPTPSGSVSVNPSHSTTPSLKRPNKRKSLADRDDDIPSHIPSSPSQPSFLAKRRKPSSHHRPSDTQSNHSEKTYCLNCGLWTPNSKFENLHGCIYHPGDFNLDGTVCSWSCCRNNDLKSRGCLITRHKGLSEATWLNGSSSGGYGQVTIQGVDHGQMSQYARIISIKG